MKLVIVESPTKSHTISHYLGEDYVVEASIGHIRDLAKSGKGGFGVDIENNFKPTYVVLDDKKDVIKNLKKLAKKSEEIYLATDPDREGEAIAWHLSDVLNLPIEDTKRLEFHEITKETILKSIENPRTINMNLVHSQEARRIIDRIIGFKLSGLLNQKIKSKSAGRVQSVVLKLICDHEKEINSFVPEEYWTIECYIQIKNNEYQLNLISVDKKKPELKNEEDALNLFRQIGDKVKVSNINFTERQTSSKEPFRTSTLQQEAFSKYNFKTKDTSLLAQQLYEGIETNEGLTGLITYMRTDSTRISEEFLDKAKVYITNKYGADYFKGVTSSKKIKLAQDAHECIRPTSLERTPESIKPYLTTNQYKLYKLIFNRTVASLMTDKIDLVKTVTMFSNNVEFNLKGITNKFPGYNILKIEEKDKTEQELPEIKEGEEFDLIKKEKNQHFTRPPARYSEGKIVRLMEEKGIGRPSTYSSTIQTLLQRKYILSEKGILSPTEQGVLTSNVLSKYFPDLMSTEYTANMELSLDKIQDGDLNEVQLLKDFYSDFIMHFDEVKQIMYKEPPKLTGENCPVCGGDMVYRQGKYGEFQACINYPTCKYIKKEKKEVEFLNRTCPECGSPLVVRKNKKGDEFIGCSNFPKCHYVESMKNEELEERICPDCGGKLVLKHSRRGSFYGCSNYPKCTHVEPLKSKK